MIKVEVRLYASLRSYRPELEVGGALSLNLEDGTIVGQLMEEVLGISSEVVKIIFVNGIARSIDYVLADADRVGIFPPVAGG